MTLLMDAPRRIEPDLHIPVLCRDVASIFHYSEKAVVVDGTLGLGGHAEALLNANPRLTLIGLECDPSALALARERLAHFGPRFRAIEASYANLPKVLEAQGLSSVNGALLDMGISSYQLQDAARGFSFIRRGPLNMRMGPAVSSRTAWDIVTYADETELARIFKIYGEERFARRVAHALKERLRNGLLKDDAVEVARAIRGALPSSARRIDPATRCFQALRIAVNHELENLEKFLASIRGLLAPGGRLAVLAYHSLEDRIVKRAFQAAVRGCACPPRAPQCACGQKSWARLLFSKAIQAGANEIAENPRARSVRLRALEKLSGLDS